MAEKVRNPNRPAKGSRISVDPIRNLADIAKLKALVAHHPRNAALLAVGLNTNLRISDILNLKAGQIRNAAPPNGYGLVHIPIRERKTGKPRDLRLNTQAMAGINRLLQSRDFADDDYLFCGQGKNKPLLVATVSKMIKSWCKQIGLKGNFASHSLRKTWGYHQRTTFGKDLPTLVQCFNHSTQRQTLEYLGISQEEIEDVFSNAL